MALSQWQLRWATGGFLIGVFVGVALWASDLFSPHFETLAEMARPRDLAAVLRFVGLGWSFWLPIGLGGGLLGFVASFARRR